MTDSCAFYPLTGDSDEAILVSSVYALPETRQYIAEISSDEHIRITRLTLNPPSATIIILTRFISRSNHYYWELNECLNIKI